MILRKTYLTAGMVWAPLLAIMTALAALRVFLWSGPAPGFESLGLILVVLAALTAFAASIVAGARYGERLAQKWLGSLAGKVGALLIVLGVMANVFLALGMFSLALPHDDGMIANLFVEQQAPYSAGQ